MRAGMWIFFTNFAQFTNTFIFYDMDTLVGIDIFSGAGGLSLGAEMAGI